MRIKIISLNIWLGGHLQDGAISFLKEQKADLILLQEVFNGEEGTLDARYRTMQVLKRELLFPYQSFAPDVNQPDKHAHIGNAILSRFPIESADPGYPIFRSEYFYNLQQAVITTPVGKIDVLNVHGPWDIDGDNFSRARQEMSGRILEIIKNKKNVILAGDTNAKPTNKAILAIEEHLKSTFGNELGTTFNMRRKKNTGYATAAVDMIFTTSNTKIIERNCLDVDISDHLPLIAVLEVS